MEESHTSLGIHIHATCEQIGSSSAEMKLGDVVDDSLTVNDSALQGSLDFVQDDCVPVAPSSSRKKGYVDDWDIDLSIQGAVCPFDALLIITSKRWKHSKRLSIQNN
jgi:hypothetical protein